MPRTAIKPKDLPILGIYTPAFKVSGGELVITAGLVGVDGNGKTVGIGDAGAQTRQTLANLRAVLEEAGASLDDVIHLRVFSTDMRNRNAINNARREVFKD